LAPYIENLPENSGMVVCLVDVECQWWWMWI